MDIWSLWGPMHLSAVDIKKFGILRHSIVYGVCEIWMSRKVLTLELNDQIKTKCQIHAITSNNSYRWKIGFYSLTHSRIPNLEMLSHLKILTNLINFCKDNHLTLNLLWMNSIFINFCNWTFPINKLQHTHPSPPSNFVEIFT